MSEEAQIYIKCLTHSRLFKPRRFKLSHKHKYAPPAIEAEIIQQNDKSTNCLRKRLSRAFSFSPQFKINLTNFVIARQKFLKELSSIPEVVSFISYILSLEAEVEEELKMQREEKAVEKMLTGEVEERHEEMKREIEAGVKIKGKEYNNLLDAISDAINSERGSSGKSALEHTITNYVNAFLDLLDWFMEQRLKIRELGVSSKEFRELLADIVTIDAIFMAENEEHLETERSIAVPLDISPLRITLALLLAESSVSNNVKNWSRIFYPPIFLLCKDGIPRLAKPYRTLDRHPMFIRVPIFDRIPERFQEEVQRALRDFQESADPLIRKIKGLTPAGKRGTRPKLIKKHLSTLLSLYLDYNPLSIENLRIIDLGCGSGMLLRDVYQKLLEERSELRTRIFMYILLNDLVENPGRGLRRDSQREEFMNKLELYVWEGDMRDLIGETYEKKEYFDIGFINRVFDIYGGYSVFRFDKKEVSVSDLSHTTVDTRELVPYDLDNRVVCFSGIASYERAWRAIAFLLDLPVESDVNMIFLPTVEMNVLNNFFKWKGEKDLNLCKKLLNVTELVLISVFPGSFQTLFPIEKPDEEGIFHYEISEPNTYSIICISKNKSLIDYLKANLSKIMTN